MKISFLMFKSHNLIFYKAEVPVRLFNCFIFVLFMIFIAPGYSAPIKIDVNIRPAPVYGSDDLNHLVYEVKLKQKKANHTRYMFKKIEVIDEKTNRVIEQYVGEQLKSLVYEIKSTGLQPEQLSMAFLYVSLPPAKKIPGFLIHRLTLVDQKHPEKKLILKDGRVKVKVTKPDLISSPVMEGGWLACNGPGILGSHRFAYLDVHGTSYIGQRFAIDWVRIDERGSVLTPGSDMQKNENYHVYGVDIHSATRGVVSVVRNEFSDNIPGQIPQEVQNVDNACGNEITVEMENGHYAHYCHLKPNSMNVHVGDLVQPGQVLASIGNSGNSTGPHLHFHISDNQSTLGSEGVPFIISSFGLQITPELVEEVGILDFHTSDTPLMDINLPGILKTNAMPMQNGVYYFMITGKSRL